MQSNRTYLWHQSTVFARISPACQANIYQTRQAYIVYADVGIRDQALEYFGAAYPQFNAIPAFVRPRCVECNRRYPRWTCSGCQALYCIHCAVHWAAVHSSICYPAAVLHDDIGLIHGAAPPPAAVEVPAVVELDGADDAGSEENDVVDQQNVLDIDANDVDGVARLHAE